MALEYTLFFRSSVSWPDTCLSVQAASSAIKPKHGLYLHYHTEDTKLHVSVTFLTVISD